MPEKTATTDATSGRTARKDASADAEPLTTGSREDTEHLEDVPTERGRNVPTPFGSGLPGEPETKEQGMVRTGRAQPAHPDNTPGGVVDTAGLTPEITKERQAKSRENRRMVLDEEQFQGEKAEDEPAERTAARTTHSR